MLSCFKIKFAIIIIFLSIISYSYSQYKTDNTIYPDPQIYFKIQIIDEETKRGIPIVKATTISGVQHYSDSAGVIAFFELALMNRDVFFYFDSPGYYFPKDGFGIAGKSLFTKQGGSETVILKRSNIAQRLYRITGTGIYNDSFLLGEKVPIKNPIIRSSVTGQDSVWTTIYKSKMFWLWGDTGHPKYPLAANFKTTCALSELPGENGLNPDIAIDFDYFQDGDFVKQMMPYPGSNPYWMNNLLVLKDNEGKECMLAGYAKIKPPMDTIERGMTKYNDEKKIFDIIKVYPEDDILQPDGHPFKLNVKGTEYFYFFSNGITRTKADYNSVVDHNAYESLTCLKQSERFNNTLAQLDKDNKGNLIYSWKHNTSSIGQNELDKMAEAGLIKDDERWFRLYDIKTGKKVSYHAGSVFWNNYRQKWTLIFTEIMGESLLGEVWYAEADASTGVWAYTIKIATHPKYSFYNPLQHPYFAKENGREIFFEGTYTITFSGAEIPTPRYDYNQVMYKLDLADERMIMPVAVYSDPGGNIAYKTKYKIEEKDLQQFKEYIKPRFFAFDCQSSGTIPIYRITNNKTGTIILESKNDLQENVSCEIAFYAYNCEYNNLNPMILPLWEYINKSDAKRFYSTDKESSDKNYSRSPKPICNVFKNPTKIFIREFYNPGKL